MRYGVIYMATNKVNGKRYIGKTMCKFKVRKYAHKYDTARGSNFVFHRAIRKYGWESFKWETKTYYDVTEEQLNYAEQQYIKRYKTRTPNGYNSTDGGEGAKGANHSKSHRDKVSLSLRGHKVSQDTKDKISKSKQEYLKKHPEYRDRMRKIGLGRKMSLETRMKLSKANIGKIISLETRMKIRRANLGRKMSKEAVERMRKTKIGKKQSPASNKKRSESIKRFYREHPEVLKRRGPASEETKRKMSESRLRYFELHPEEKQRISKFMKKRNQKKCPVDGLLF